MLRPRGSVGGPRISAGAGVRAAGGFRGASWGTSGGSKFSIISSAERGPSGVSVSPTFRQAEGIRAAAARAGFPTQRIGGSEGVRAAGPRLTIDRSRPLGMPSAEPGRAVKTVISGREVSSRIDKSSFTSPVRVQDAIPGIRAYATASEINASYRKDAAPIRTQRALSPTRLMHGREPGRQSISDGGTGRAEHIPANRTNTLQIRPNVLDRPPVASPRRVVPDNIRQVPVTESRTLPVRAVNERANRNPSNGKVTVVDFVKRRRVASGPESGQRAPSTSELVKVLEETSPKVELAATPATVRDAVLSLTSGSREAAILAELSIIGSNIPARMKPDARITDSNVLPLRKPESSRAAVVTPSTEQSQDVDRLALGRKARVASVYIDLLEEVKRKREGKETKLKKTIRLQLSEQLATLQRKLQFPDEEPANAPVKIVQTGRNAQAVLAPDRQRLLQPTAKPDAQVVPALNPNPEPIPQSATKNAPKLGAVPALELQAKERTRVKQLVEEEEKLTIPKTEEKGDMRYRVDESAQGARRAVSFQAIEANANPDGTIDGELIAAALGQAKGGSVISALIKTLGFLYGSVNEKFSQTDGSLAKLQIRVAGVRRAGKKELRDIVMDQTETDPAVRSGKSGGREVGEREVQTVLNGAPLPQPVAA